MNENRDILAQSLHTQAQLTLQRGDGEEAALRCRESLALLTKGGWKRESMECLETMAGAATLLGQSERAARLCGAADALRERLGTPLRPFEQAPHGQRVAALQATLGEEAFAAAWAEGQELSLELAFAEALRSNP